MRSLRLPLAALSLAAVTACGGTDEPTTPAAAATRAQQIAVIEQRLAATNARDWDKWESLHTVNATRIAPEFEQPLEGRAAMRAAIQVLSTAFPDYHLELLQAFGDGEWLAVRIHTTGTMTGPLMLSDGTEVPPTGRPITQDWTALVRFEGDKIAAFDEYYDQLTLMTQLGLTNP